MKPRNTTADNLTNTLIALTINLETILCDNKRVAARRKLPRPETSLHEQAEKQGAHRQQEVETMRDDDRNLNDEAKKASDEHSSPKHTPRKKRNIEKTNEAENRQDDDAQRQEEAE